MCHLRSNCYAEACRCDDYRGAVKNRVHAAAEREHAAARRAMREDNEVQDREEAGELLAETGDRDDAIAESLRVHGIERTKEMFGWIPQDVLDEYRDA